jgi:hypothetical protein
MLRKRTHSNNFEILIKNVKISNIISNSLLRYQKFIKNIKQDDLNEINAKSKLCLIIQGYF